ncbi:hypothetical protein J6590_009947 [Homalodisca vitripennis]|nr:hypothetical protein J6590_009947 [Homalodisca vitripennis]
MPCDRSTNRKHRRPAKNKVKLTSLQCRMASDIRVERQNSNVGQRPTYEGKGRIARTNYDKTNVSCLQPWCGQCC